MQRAQGRLDAALGTYRQALEITAPPGQPALPAAGIAFVGLAEVAYQRNELELLSATSATASRYAASSPTPPQPLATGLATLAWIRQAKRDHAGALEAMGEAEGVAPSPAVTGLLNPVPAQRAQLLLAQGEVAAAARWTKDSGLGAGDEPTYQREREHLVLARVLLAQGSPHQALALLERLHALAAAQQRTGSRIEIQALQALALAATGEHAGAIAALAETLHARIPEGYVRVFADEGAPMTALLGRLIAAQRARAGPRPRHPARLPQPAGARLRGRRRPRDRARRSCLAWSSR